MIQMEMGHIVLISMGIVAIIWLVVLICNLIKAVTWELRYRVYKNKYGDPVVKNNVVYSKYCSGCLDCSVCTEANKENVVECNIRKALKVG